MSTDLIVADRPDTSSSSTLQRSSEVTQVWNEVLGVLQVIETGEDGFVARIRNALNMDEQLHPGMPGFAQAQKEQLDEFEDIAQDLAIYIRSHETMLAIVLIAVQQKRLFELRSADSIIEWCEEKLAIPIPAEMAKRVMGIASVWPFLCEIGMKLPDILQLKIESVKIPMIKEIERHVRKQRDEIEIEMARREFSQELSAYRQQLDRRSKGNEDDVVLKFIKEVLPQDTQVDLHHRAMEKAKPKLRGRVDTICSASAQATVQGYKDRAGEPTRPMIILRGYYRNGKFHYDAGEFDLGDAEIAGLLLNRHDLYYVLEDEDHDAILSGQKFAKALAPRIIPPQYVEGRLVEVSDDDDEEDFTNF